MTKARKQIIKNKVEWSFKQLFCFGWLFVIISSAALFNNPPDSVLITCFLIGVVCSALGTIEILTGYFSVRITSIIWKKPKKLTMGKRF